MTQKYLGTVVGFPEKTAGIRMAQYESGSRTPKADLTENLAGALGVSPLALSVPDIDSYLGLMHTLFTLEDRYGLTVDTGENVVSLRVNPRKGDVKDVVANAPAANDIPLVQIETKTAQINDVAEYDISQRLKETFGVEVSGVDIGAIEIDKSSEGYRQLMSVTKDIASAKVQAETTDYVERLRIQREEGQYAMHKQTQSANIGAFQVEKQTEVGIAGAEALGHMGENGAGGVDLGNGGTGFNPAAMMAGMALGGAVGQNIAGIMNNSMAGVNQTAPSGATPPPVPVVAYHVAVNGQATGPFDLNVLQQMATSGQFNADSLVWKNGMSEWVKAGTIDELKSMFVVMPPIPPVE